MENGWKMEDGKWKPDSSLFGVAGKPWRDSPGGRSEEAAYPTLPASGHLARLALRGSTSGLLVIRQMTLTRSKVVGNLRQRAGTGGNRQKTSRVPVARAPSLFRSR